MGISNCCVFVERNLTLISKLATVLLSEIRAQAGNRNVVDSRSIPELGKILLSSLCGVGVPLPRQIEQVQGRESIFCHPRPPNCLGQMLNARVLSQHLVSSSNTIRPDIPWSARCVGHCKMIWLEVCSVAAYSQFKHGVRPLCALTNESV